MYTYKIWDKVSPIGGYTAEEFIIKNSFLSNQDVFTVHYGESTCEIVGVNLAKQSLRLPIDTDVEIVASKYVEYLNNKPTEEKQLQDKISILTEQNELLKQQVEALTQAFKSTLPVDQAELFNL